MSVHDLKTEVYFLRFNIHNLQSVLSHAHVTVKWPQMANYYYYITNKRRDLELTCFILNQELSYMALNCSTSINI